MTNREQIKARIERDKARKAAKQYAKAHGTWWQEDSRDPEELSEAVNRAMRRRLLTGEAPGIAALSRIEAMNRAIPAEERVSRTVACGEFREVFTIRNLMKSLQKRRRGVEWKGNVQRYLFHAVLKLKRTKDALLRGKLNVDGTIRRIALHERGKRRVIHAVMIDCRVVQGCLCDSCLIPLTERKLIRDNPASVKGRGVSDARARLEHFLKAEARRHGNQFYVLTSDFRKFFDSLRHRDCLAVFRAIGADRMLQGLGMKICRMYQEGELDEIADPQLREQAARRLRQHQGVGLTLGSQESQTMALAIPSRLDHAIKDGLRLRAYLRYMDDIFAASGRIETLKETGRTIRREAAKIGLRLNPKKTAITRASRGIRFLQIFYRVTASGHLVKELSRAGIVRMRRKLKKFRRMVERGVMTPDQAFGSFAAWFGNARYASSYRTRKGMLTLYNRLFHRYRTEGLYA